MACKRKLPLQLHGDSVQLACEIVRRRVGEVEGRAAVLADILPFVERVLIPRRLFHAALADLLAAVIVNDLFLRSGAEASGKATRGVS